MRFDPIAPVWHRLWSIRFALLSAMCGLITVLLQTGTDLLPVWQAALSPMPFAILSTVFGFLSAVSRVVHQSSDAAIACRPASRQGPDSMNIPSVSLLPWWVKPLAIVTVLAGVGYGIYHTGYQAAAHDWQAKLDKQKADYESTLRQKAEAKSRELAKAASDTQKYAQLAHQLGVTLLATESQLKAKQQQLKQRIPDAIRMDGQHWTGLGPVSLRLYQAELGYGTAGDPGLPETQPGDAAKADQAAPVPGYHQKTSWLTPVITAPGAARWKRSLTA
ncbi:DUF7940 domain-containing protein [Paludibacterium denitrificans]|uniref:Uncharacterized protein n=1 Tax=Paludibacterium denitrificans TaxID=2675226 RepID=A0A844GGF4_9NEIS|nr:hypothetical protein [Paludibacterium denitrificans]MTD33967.1 hypothetical protein [Paludibacterium denitrificans]